MKRLEDMTEPELAAVMRFLAEVLVEAAAAAKIETPRFCLLLFNDPRVAQYVGNCERATMIEALREAADRLERHEDLAREGTR
jgi:hypothetical protein